MSISNKAECSIQKLWTTPPPPPPPPPPTGADPDDLNNNGIPDYLEDMIKMMDPVSAAKFLVAMGVAPAAIANFLGSAALNEAMGVEGGGKNSFFELEENEETNKGFEFA
ncbi:MAG: hypothetical protein ACJAUP_001825 [Cellvibrionaceae bacterium]|jgi:hypothetical protein